MFAYSSHSAVHKSRVEDSDFSIPIPGSGVVNSVPDKLIFLGVLVSSIESFTDGI